MSDAPEAKAKAGVPAWVMTFADLMTLLMCFFVLLLSFAEMDILKFKQVAGSMREAFGVQRIVPSDRSETDMDFTEGQVTDMPVFEKVGELDSLDPKALDPQAMEKLLEEMQEKETEAEALKLAALLSEEIKAGLVELESSSDSIIIRISEKASFPSGRAKLRSGFTDILDKIHAALAEVEGTITVAGHTDNRPINTKRFRSNWELSSGRAVSVVHALLRPGLLDPNRFLVEGHGDAHPLVPNDTPENRARNRRVELTIILRKVNGELLGTGESEPGAEEVGDETLAEPDGAPIAPGADAPTVAPALESSQPDFAPAELGPILIDADAPLANPDSGSNTEPAGLEQELPGVDALLPDFDGELDTPAELETLLRALDAATEESPADKE
ncbi:MAG: type VI secretion system protein TssL, long form [Gammaproteobacteria bacterium]|nr:type VI secretion system protein TssL, long form [Gammaproteobacteria bacterium]MBQ0841023.1 type VI secretion system protein TssL, long form [Gammaproteobacteria bacterium]